MDARATAKYVKAVGTIAYAQPEILALPQETLDAIMADEQVAPYRFALEDLLRAKPHTLTAPEEKLLAAFGEAFGTRKMLPITWKTPTWCSIPSRMARATMWS